MKLDINQLSVAYRSGADTVRPIDRFDLSVATGELVLLHGPSGCGKTTLLSTIAGLLTPESGSIMLDGTDIVGLRGRALLEHRRSQIGMVYQGFNLLASLSARENVMVPLTLAGDRRSVARRRADGLLTDVGLGDRLHHRPGQMSGGQQQRVAIARALANDPAVLLADEPTAHLDSEQVIGVRHTLRRLADAGRIVIVSTHDPRLESAADRIVSMTTRPAAFDSPVQGGAHDQLTHHFDRHQVAVQ
jgi:putative ABC transport system ATP-binding protein